MHTPVNIGAAPTETRSNRNSRPACFRDRRESHESPRCCLSCLLVIGRPAHFDTSCAHRSITQDILPSIRPTGITSVSLHATTRLRRLLMSRQDSTDGRARPLSVSRVLGAPGGLPAEALRGPPSRYALRWTAFAVQSEGWAHFESIRINITPTIVRKKIEDLRQLDAFDVPS